MNLSEPNIEKFVATQTYEQALFLKTMLEDASLHARLDALLSSKLSALQREQASQVRFNMEQEFYLPAG